MRVNQSTQKSSPLALLLYTVTWGIKSCKTVPDKTNTYLKYLFALDPHWILVDSDGMDVLEDGLGFLRHPPQIIGHEERRGHDAPHGHLGLLLLYAQSEVANNQLECKQTIHLKISQL